MQAEMPGVQQMIQNLLENALKYGGSLVRLRVSAGVLEVYDSGSGPDQAQWERLLRPFEGSGKLLA